MVDFLVVGNGCYVTILGESRDVMCWGKGKKGVEERERRKRVLEHWESGRSILNSARGVKGSSSGTLGSIQVKGQERIVAQKAEKHHVVIRI